VGVWGLTRIATAGTRYTLDYFTAAKSNQLSTITTVIADEYAALYDAAKAEIDAAPEALKKPLSKMKELVGKGVSGLISTLSPLLKNIHNRFLSADVAYFIQGNTIKYVTIHGNEFAKIENGIFTVTHSKGSIPAPSNYLAAGYRMTHNDAFINEGAGFIVVKSWIEDGSYSAMPPRKYVGLRSHMDAVIAKYKAGGNDWTILRDELNLGATTNLAPEEIYYIKIDGNDPRFTFDMPDGNESGAIVGEWVPGGFTKSGTAEAALVGSENIIHNKDINQLLSYFDGKWEKIK
jgi:hypothetical protein